MALDNNAFCWNGIVSSDAAKAAAFYEATIGWTLIDHTYANGEKDQLLTCDDFPRAHMRAPHAKDEAGHWSSYLRVDDIEDAVTRAKENGGSVIDPPTEIPPGRFAVLKSPAGATTCLFREAHEDHAQHAPPGPGGVSWTELHSADIDADVKWLAGTFGFEVGQMPIPNGGTYYMLNSGGKTRGGAVAAFKPELAGLWLNWIHVENVDATAAKVKQLGGSVLSDPVDFPNVGRMSIATDPTGGLFGLLTPA